MIIAFLNTNLWILIATVVTLALMGVFETWRGRGIKYIAKIVSIIPFAMVWIGGFLFYKLDLLPYYIAMYFVVGVVNYLLVNENKQREASIFIDLIFWFDRFEKLFEARTLMIFGRKPAR